MHTVSNISKPETSNSDQLAGDIPDTVRHEEVPSKQGSLISDLTEPGVQGKSMSIIPANMIMMQPIEEEEEVVQMQPLEEEEEILQPIIQRQEEEEEQTDIEQEEEGMTLGEIGQAISETFLRHPPTLSGFCVDRANEIEEFLLKMTAGSRYYYTVQSIFSGFFNLALDLSNTEGETTEEQRSRYTELQTSWEDVQQDIEDYSRAEIQRNLRKTRKLIEEIKLQLVLVYRQVYLSGEDSTIEIIISETDEETSTLRNIADQVTGLLSEINAADAAMTGRQVAPALTALSRAFQLVNVILGWNFTGELDSASQEAFDDLQNGLAVAMTAASFTAAAAYLPLFGHIPVLLGAISKQWDRLVDVIRDQNTLTWEEFGSMPGCSEEPGGCETLEYMISVFEAGSYEDVTVPPEEAADFFISSRDMFNTVASEVMEGWQVPTESNWLVFTEINEESFSPWVYFNKEWIWKLIYGERSFPETK